MLNILIVEDEPLFASTLKHLVELNPLRKGLFSLRREGTAR